LTRLGASREDMEDWEGCCNSFELEGWVDCLQNGLVHELGEVGYGMRRSRVEKHVHLEVIVVLVRLVNLIRAIAEWFLITY